MPSAQALCPNVKTGTSAPEWFGERQERGLVKV
jgi:hypothetical protein